MAISAGDVQKLREKTGQGMMECKRALEESGGNVDKAIEVLRKKGLATAESKSARKAAQGRIHSYIHHNGKVGVLVEVNCETDFVAKNEQFQAFLSDLCLHICAMAPVAVRRDEMPAALVETEKRIAREQVAGKKPEAIIEKIVERQTRQVVRRARAAGAAVRQGPGTRTVQNVLTDLIAKIGENIVIRRFAGSRWARRQSLSGLRVACRRLCGAHASRLSSHREGQACHPSFSDGKPGTRHGWRYKRVLLKISGEGFCKPGGFGLDPEEVRTIARQIRDVAGDGCQLAVVVGGGNYLRGVQFSKLAHIKRATADYMGMVATVINAMALQDCLESLETDTRLLCAVEMKDVAEPFIRRRALRHLEKGRVVILAGGTGNPFFTTDTAAALRASELGAEALLKATKVDAVYSDDPKTNPKATRYTTLTYDDVIRAGPEDHGRGRHHPMQRQPYPRHRVRPEARRQHPQSGGGRAPRNPHRRLDPWRPTTSSWKPKTRWTRPSSTCGSSSGRCGPAGPRRAWSSTSASSTTARRRNCGNWRPSRCPTR